MNIAFWLLLGCLIIMALFILIPPLWKNKEIKNADSDQRNINIAQEQAKDLKQQLETGELRQDQYDEQYAELELSLGDDLDLDTKSQSKSSQGRWVVFVIGLLLPIFSIALYLVLGETDALRKEQFQVQLQQQVRAAQASTTKVEEIVLELLKRLEQQPDNAQGWIMLGRSYKHLEQFQLAAEAFKKAYDLLGDDPEVMLHYADSLAMAAGGTLSGLPAELIFKALKKSPNNLTALWLGGMAKAEKGEFHVAVSYWKQLQQLLPVGSESHKELQVMLASVKAEISPEKQLKSTVSIAVTVNLDQALNDKVSDTDTLFIYAKALTGPPMPLAIVRKQVSDLPLTTTLNDAMAMIPNMKISNFQQVKVIARISKTGNAMPQAGDLTGEFIVQKLIANQTINVVITDEIK